MPDNGGHAYTYSDFIFSDTVKMAFTKDIKACIRTDVNNIKKKVQALYPRAEVTVEEITEGVQVFRFTNKPDKVKTTVYVMIEVLE